MTGTEINGIGCIFLVKRKTKISVEAKDDKIQKVKIAVSDASPYVFELKSVAANARHTKNESTFVIVDMNLLPALEGLTANSTYHYSLWSE